jgi:hypothetical protein
MIAFASIKRNKVGTFAYNAYRKVNCSAHTNVGGNING